MMGSVTRELEAGMPSGHHWVAESTPGQYGLGPQLLFLVLCSETTSAALPSALNSQDQQLGSWALSTYSPHTPGELTVGGLREGVLVIHPLNRMSAGVMGIMLVTV
jgi:hypothetical protein